MRKRNMSTHELADALEDLIRSLRAFPDVALDDLLLLSKKSRIVESRAPRQTELISQAEIFSELLESSKSDLIRLIDESGVLIPYSSKDSAEAIARRLRRAMEEDPSVERRIVKVTRGSTSLSRALRTLREFSGK
jgi:hypothetical protein